MLNKLIILVGTISSIYTSIFAERLITDSLKSDTTLQTNKDRILTYKDDPKYLKDLGISKNDTTSEGRKITLYPLKSYVYPDKSNLNREEMIEHFRWYTNYYRSKGLPEHKITKSYYFKLDIDLDKEVINSKSQFGLEYMLSNIENSAIILLVELKNEGDNSQKFIVTEILKDIYEFYRLGDKITYKPIGSLERHWDDLLGDFYPAEMELGDKVILAFGDKDTHDICLFNKITYSSETHFNPYITWYDPVYMNGNKLLYAYRKFTLDDLRNRLKKSYNSEDVKEFYKIDYKSKLGKH